MENLIGDTTGLIHVIASCCALLFGTMILVAKKPTNTWKYLHFTFIYWSVIGLYAAFSAEILTRIPNTPFFEMVGIATGGIMLIGGVCFGINKAKWIQVFETQKQ